MSDAVPHGCLWDAVETDRAGVTAPDAVDGSSDVIVVGAGFTGLWTALYLVEADPRLRVRVVERHHIGYGASGRNGGWSSALLPMSVGTLVARHGVGVARASVASMNSAVAEIRSRAVDLGVGEYVAPGGWLQLAHGDVQLERLREQHRLAETYDVPEALGTLLDRDAAYEMVGSEQCRGGLFTPHCSAVDPGRLVRALGAEVRRRGVEILEGVEVVLIEPGRVVTDRGTLTAPVVLRATEAFTSTLRGMRRRVVPLYSMMVATEPLPTEVVDRLIAPSRPTFNDTRHMIIYGQRTRDDRIAFGGRGAPYHFGSRIHGTFDHDQRVAAMLVETLREMFPALRAHRFTHHWGGPLAAPRDWHCSVTFDRTTGLGAAGGYVGDGVTTANLAGRTLCDLVLGLDTERTRLPWVGHRSRSWEPEPLRWLAINSLTRLASLADSRESRTGRRARTLELLLARVLGS